MAVQTYLKKNVWEAALERVEWAFDEFDKVSVNFSGGKDSTVVLNLALKVARERGKLPLEVFFIDQEAEWEHVIDYVTSVMTSPEVSPRWFQMPIRLFNATSGFENWLHCWDPKREADWIHPKHELSIKENTYGTDRFAKLFGAIRLKDERGAKTCHLVGVRAEESPARRMSLGCGFNFKGRTAGKNGHKGKGECHITYWPIYDWSYTDVWHAICENDWAYCPLYDYYHRYGIHPRNMRVSNVHHETAVTTLFHLQEIEPLTYAKLTKRIPGIDMAAKMGKEDYFPRTLPYMFSDWREYRDYLLEKLIVNPEHRQSLARKFAVHDRDMRRGKSELALIGEEKILKVHITSIMTNDWEGVKLNNLRDSSHLSKTRKGLKTGRAKGKT